MITSEMVSAITSEKFFGHLLVKKVGEGVFEVIGWLWGEQSSKCTGDAATVAKFLSGYHDLLDSDIW